MKMVSSNTEKFKQFFPQFVNSLGQIAILHGCELINPTGDGLTFSFPQTSNRSDPNVIINVLECFFEQLEIRQSYSIGPEKREISSRICTDYETMPKFEPGNEKDSEQEIGPRLPSRTDKIRWRVPAQANSVIVGDEFHKVIMSFPLLHERYLFESKGDIIIDRVPYPVYQLFRRERNQKDLTSKSVTAI